MVEAIDHESEAIIVLVKVVPQKSKLNLLNYLEHDLDRIRIKVIWRELSILGKVIIRLNGVVCSKLLVLLSVIVSKVQIVALVIVVKGTLSNCNLLVALLNYLFMVMN